MTVETKVVSCNGPTGNATSVSAVLRCHSGGSVDVSCPKYIAANEYSSASTCALSSDSSRCVYRIRIVPKVFGMRRSSGSSRTSSTDSDEIPERPEFDPEEERRRFEHESNYGS